MSTVADSGEFFDAVDINERWRFQRVPAVTPGVFMSADLSDAIGGLSPLGGYPPGLEPDVLSLLAPPGDPVRGGEPGSFAQRTEYGRWLGEAGEKACSLSRGGLVE